MSDTEHRPEHRDERKPADPQSGHAHSGHSHAHGPAPASSARLKRILAAVTIPIIVANVIAMIVMWPSGTVGGSSLSSPAGSPGLIAATVTGVDVEPCKSEFAQDSGVEQCLAITVRLSSGPEAKQSTTFQMAPSLGFQLHKGNKIYVERINTAPDGATEKPVYSFYEYKRERPLIALAVIFCLITAVIGRKHGIRALIALAISLGILIKFILPAIIAGQSPLFVALVGSSAVMFLALYLSHGVNARTTTAVLGTIASLGITGLIASVAVAAAHFTGLASEEATFVRATSGDIDLHGLLLAGIIIGALGVLDDVTVTQASAVWELHEANPTRGWLATGNAAMRIGRDHISSVVNTLVLAYAGATLPLLILFTQSGTPLGEVFNGEPVATEIVRMLAGSIGLMTAVPITTYLAAIVVGADAPPADHSGSSASPAPRTEASATKSRREWRPPRSERDIFGGKPD